MIKQATKTRKPTEITSPVVYRCTDKVTGQIFYAVPSDTTDAIYKVTFNAVTRRYEDNCPACVECKHVRAVRQVCQAKAEMRKEQVATSAIPVEERTEHQDNGLDAAVAEYLRTTSVDYDLLGSTKTTAAMREAKRLEEEETRQANVRYMYNDL